MKQSYNLTNYVKASFPLINIKTDEIKRAINTFYVDQPFNKYCWNAINGINSEYVNINDLLDFSTTIKNSIIFIESGNWFFEEKGVLQLVLNNIDLYKNNSVTLCIVQTDKINSFFDKIVHDINFDLPEKIDFIDMINNLNLPENIKKTLNSKTVDKIANCLLGLSFEESQNILAKSIVDSGKIDLAIIDSSKENIINNSGFMTICKSENIESVGGLKPLKLYINKRLQAYDEKNSHMPKLKNIMLVGIPGCGKSLVGKTIASLMNRTFITANMGNMKNSLVGETEKNTRKFTDIIDKLGNNAVVLMDEIEKQFSTGSGDSTNSSQLGHMLTWFNDRTNDAVIVATANNLDSLPSEFLRCGRWDAIFFVDYPNNEERKEIITIMNKKYKTKINTNISEKMLNFSGAEIEQVIKDSYFDDIKYLLANTPTLYKTNKSKIDRIKAFSKNYRKANSNDLTTNKTIENNNFSRTIN
ncbi:MAG: AAA family ATPase [Lutibacter sp.]|uniref:AAA family ATPase n=1 Tax=Lutibacter sp. TaxID=1925666 RepID=UPI0019FA7B11|nr:AAA family ATPase [Lutibacter sp.]NOR27567.1 AAA family ATPase [Lutibacter sp.]